MRILRGTLVLENACPVGAFSEAGYDVAACAGYLRSAAGRRLHGRGMPGSPGVPGRRGARLRPRTGEFSHARVPARAGRLRSSEATGARRRPRPRPGSLPRSREENQTADREIDELHERPPLALKVTRSSSSCANVSVIPPSMPSMARSRASFVG